MTDLSKRLRERGTPTPHLVWADEADHSKGLIDPITIEAADALDAKDRETAELTLDLRAAYNAGYAARNDVVDAHRSKISLLTSKLEEAEKALEPFARYETADGAGLDDELFRSPDEHPLLGNGIGDSWTPVVTVGDFRNARATLDRIRSKPAAASEADND